MQERPTREELWIALVETIGMATTVLHNGPTAATVTGLREMADRASQGGNLWVPPVARISQGK